MSFEGFRNEAYEDSGKVWTIGFGTIRYPSGAAVAEHNECTHEQALEWLKFDVDKSVKVINRLHWQKPLSQSQIDALVSFQYNTGHLPGSTLYKKASVNPDDETIYNYETDEKGNVVVDSAEFLRWVRVKGNIIKGLINRRKAEADLYAGMWK